MSEANTAVYFLSTGRCGTQWFAKAFEDIHTDVAEIVTNRQQLLSGKEVSASS